jgi:hypothetical protein
MNRIHGLGTGEARPFGQVSSLRSDDGLGPTDPSR